MKCMKKLLARSIVYAALLLMTRVSLADTPFPSSLYIVIDLTQGDSCSIETLNESPYGGWGDEYKTTKLVLRRIEPDGETLRKPYYIGVFETTRMQYALITGQDVPDAESAMLPAANVSYTELRGSSETADWPLFTNVDEGSPMWTLRQKTGLAFDLPTEAQWEYACRAGTDGATQWNDGSSIVGTSTDTNLNQLALYRGNTTNGTATVVGSFNPNRWGLYDMHGNVGEWCLDWYGTVTNGIVMDGEAVGCLSGTARTLRGGYYLAPALYCCSTARLSTYPSRGYPYFGFRFVVRQASAANEDVVAVYFDANEGTMTERKRKYNRGAVFGDLPVPVRSGHFFDGWFTAAVGGYKRMATETVDITQTLYAHWTYRTDNLYMVVDLSEGANATSYPVTYLSQVPEGGWTEEYKTEKLVLRRIDPGTFKMGSPTNEVGRSEYDHSNEGERLHTVTLTKPYYIGVFEFTQRQHELVTGRPGISDDYYARLYHYIDPCKPALMVRYSDLRGDYGWPTSSTVSASSIMGRLRSRTGLTFDLPTEAQWEYACRAGTTTALNSGKNFKSIYKPDGTFDNDYYEESMAENAAMQCEVARCSFNRCYYSDPDEQGNVIWGTYDASAGITNVEHFAKVGSYRPNMWGLYDMHGNVRERCLDLPGPYSTSAQTDPKGPVYTGSETNPGNIPRMLRGGYYFVHDSRCLGAIRSASRAHGVDNGYMISTEDGCRIAVQDTTLAEAAVVTVTFDPNGGTADQTARTYADGSVFGTLPVPTRTGGMFLGWFTAATGGTEVTAKSKVSGSVTLYAHWDVPEIEVTSSNVPYDWLREHGYSNDFETVAATLTGKRDGSGRALTVADDYIMGTNPTKSNDVFTASLAISNGVPYITWSPDLNTNGIVRTYTVLGKTNLTDTADWAPTNSAHRFFKVKVELP